MSDPDPSIAALIADQLALLRRLQQQRHDGAVTDSPLFSSEHWKHHASPDWPEKPDDDSYFAFENCVHPDCVLSRANELDAAASAFTSHVWDRNAPTVPYLGQMLPQDIDVARTFNESSDPRAMLAFIKLLAVGRAPRASALRGVRPEQFTALEADLKQRTKERDALRNDGSGRVYAFKCGCEQASDGRVCQEHHRATVDAVVARAEKAEAELSALRGVRVTTDQDHESDTRRGTMEIRANPPVPHRNAGDSSASVPEEKP